MIHSAITISLVPEARGGPFVFWDGLAAGCANAAKLGFDAVEIFPRSLDELNAKELRRLLAQHNLKLAAMGTGAGWIVHQLRLTDPDAATRRQAQQFVADIIDFAAGFGAPAIIGSMQGRAEGDAAPPGSAGVPPARVSRAQALDWLREALEQLGPRAHAIGVPLLFEFLNRYETNLLNRAADTVEFLAPFRTQNVKILCDLFHMNIEEPSVPDALRAAGPRLGHVHFADSNRRAAGFGHTDFAPIARVLRDMGFRGFVSAEILPWPDSDTAARQTMSSFRQWFNPPASPPPSCLSTN